MDERALGRVDDADLVLLARSGDRAAFGLLVGRHRSGALARARALGLSAVEADDVVQEAFLQALVRLERLQDPRRFAAWVNGIVFNVHRAACRRRQAEALLLGDELADRSPASQDGLPGPLLEERDLREAVSQALRSLPEPQQEAITRFYYLGHSVEQIAIHHGGTPGAVKARLHKARGRLRREITAHRPDLVPYLSRSTPMITTRIQHLTPLPGAGLTSHVLVLLTEQDVPQGPDARDARGPVRGLRALPLWLAGHEGLALQLLAEKDAGPDAATGTPAELTTRLLQACSARVTGADITELGPDVVAAQLHVTTASGTRQVPARLAEALTLAVLAEAPIRVAEQVMERLGEPADDPDLPQRLAGRRPSAAGPDVTRTSQPRNLTFTDGLDGWHLRGSFLRGPTVSAWQDYTCHVTPGHTAVLAATTPQPHGFADLRQAIQAGHLRGQSVTITADIRHTPATGSSGYARRGAGSRAGDPLAQAAATGLYLRTVSDTSARTRTDTRTVTPAEPTGTWIRQQASVTVPDDATFLLFGITLTGPGTVEIRDAHLAPGDGA